MKSALERVLIILDEEISMRGKFTADYAEKASLARHKRAKEDYQDKAFQESSKVCLLFDLRKRIESLLLED